MRQKNGWSLDAASEKTGVSKAMLGQIERGESSPTVSTLWKIANGFEISFSTFVKDLDVDMDKKPTKQKSKIHSKDKKALVTPVVLYDKKLRFEVYLIELLPGCTYLSKAHRKGIVEHIVPVDGQIEVFADDVWQKVKKNSSFSFKADQAHGYRNNSAKKTAFHNIIHYPAR